MCSCFCVLKSDIFIVDIYFGWGITVSFFYYSIDECNKILKEIGIEEKYWLGFRKNRRLIEQTIEFECDENRTLFLKTSS